MKLNKSKIIGYGFALLVSGGLAIAVTPHQARGDFDLPGLNRQVQRQEEQLDNHESRLNNLEGDTRAIQTATNISPSEHQDVPQVSTDPASISGANTVNQPLDPDPSTVIVGKSRYAVPGTNGYQWDYYENTTYKDGHIEIVYIKSGNTPTNINN